MLTMFLSRVPRQGLNGESKCQGHKQGRVEEVHNDTVKPHSRTGQCSCERLGRVAAATIRPAILPL